jgi:copper transport protein
VGSLYALVHTTYGRTLVVKILLVIGLIGVGALSRRIVHGGWGVRLRVRRPAPKVGGAAPGPVRSSRLRRSVLAEIGIALAVLAVTALLVNAVPAKQAAALPFSTSFTTLGVQVNAIVDPARVGTGNQVHIYVLSSIGTPKAIPELDATLSLPAQDLGPLDIPLTIGAPATTTPPMWTSPSRGPGPSRITVRTDAIDEQVVPVTFPVH